MNLLLPTHRPAARRGSALLLSVVIVVLLTLMGAAYLQVARTDRRTSVDVDTRANTDDPSILRFIARVLAADVPVGPTAAEPEPYDFPWTNAGYPTNDEEKWVVPDRFAPIAVPGPQPDFTSGNNNQFAREPRGGADLQDAKPNTAPAEARIYAESGGGDDPWLASNEPVFAGGVATWPHITNLMGVYLDLDLNALVPDLDGNGHYPAQYLSTADDAAKSGSVGLVLDGATGEMQAEFEAAQLTANKGGLFADADGDGIADSRWTWAPLPADGGRAYVMGVRIVDNSALINVNAWSADSGSASGPEERPRWLWPADLALGQSLAQLNADAVASPGVTTPDLTRNEVLTNPSARGMPGTGRVERYQNWLTTVSSQGGDPSNLNRRFRYVGTLLERNQRTGGTPATGNAGGEDFGDLELRPIPDRLFGARTEELELRWKNGLNRTDDNVTARPPTQLEQLDAGGNRLFRTNRVETAFNDTPYSDPSLQPFFEDEPRKRLTTLSGSGNAGRVNLNTAGRDLIAGVFSAPLSFNGGGGNERAPAVFDHFNFSLIPTGTPEERFNDAKERFGRAVAAVAADYADDDAADGGEVRLTRFENALGMERLPVVSEVYAHARQTATAVVGDPSGGDEVTFAYQDHAVVVEVVNPWPVPTRVKGVTLDVNGAVWGDLADLLGKEVLDGHEIALIRREEAGAGGGAGVGTPPPATAVTTDAPKAPAPDDYPVDAPANGPGPLLRLVVNDSMGNAYAYQLFQVYGFAATSTQVVDAGTVATGDTRYLFTRRAGTANGLNALAVRNADHRGEVVTQPTTTGLPAPDDQNPFVPDTEQATLGSTLGTAAKGVTSPAADVTGGMLDLDTRVGDAPVPPGASPLTPPLTPTEPWTVADTGRIHRAGDVLRMVLVSPIPVGRGFATVADSWVLGHLNAAGNAARMRISDRMIDLADTALVTEAGPADPGDAEAVGFASYWLHRFTTDAETGSSLVPGRLNLNTASERVIAQALPLVDPLAADAVAAAIVSRRENLGATAGRRAGRSGLATVADAIGNAPATSGFLDPAFNNDQLPDFNEAEMLRGATLATAGLGPGSPADDGYTGDREERDRLITYLNQVASTRSDVYTAYVVVRAYPVNDFRVEPLEEYRLLAIFDRSNVTDRNPTARIVAAVKLDDN